MKHLFVLVLCVLLIFVLIGAIVAEFSPLNHARQQIIAKKEKKQNHDPLPTPPNPPKPPPPTVA